MIVTLKAGSKKEYAEAKSVSTLLTTSARDLHVLPVQEK